jgi:hypothetical protein
MNPKRSAYSDPTVTEASCSRFVLVSGAIRPKFRDKWSVDAEEALWAVTVGGAGKSLKPVSMYLCCATDSNLSYLILSHHREELLMLKSLSLRLVK